MYPHPFQTLIYWWFSSPKRQAPSCYLRCLGSALLKRLVAFPWVYCRMKLPVNIIVATLCRWRQNPMGGDTLCNVNQRTIVTRGSRGSRFYNTWPAFTLWYSLVLLSARALSSIKILRSWSIRSRLEALHTCPPLLLVATARPMHTSTHRPPNFLV